MKFSSVAAAILAFALPATAHAGTATFNGVCHSGSATATRAKCTTTAGSSGAVVIKATDDSSLSVMITAWQINQATSGANAGKVTAAKLGAYDKGFGVTGSGDNGGDNNYHQIDNAGGYTDFIMLQFSRDVQLTSATLNVFGIKNPYGSGTSTDSDLSFLNLGALTGDPSQWNSSINPASMIKDASLWSASNGTGSRTAQLSANGFSQVWLISAAMLPTNDRDDGFKLASIIVKTTPSVPEPATWAMLIVGFGAIGASLRRRRNADVPALA